LKNSVLAAIGDLEIIRRKAPEDLDGKALLIWAHDRVANVMVDVGADLQRLDGIIAKIKGTDRQSLAQHRALLHSNQRQ